MELGAIVARGKPVGKLALSDRESYPREFCIDIIIKIILYHLKKLFPTETGLVMIDIKILASDSSGNCYLISDGNKKVLIDPGIKYDLIQKALDFKTSHIDFCLISHEHKDHCLSASKIAVLGVPILTSKGTHGALDYQNANFHRLESEKEISFLNWRVLPFRTEHDAAEPLGFLIQSPSGAKVLYAVDTNYLRYKFEGVTHYMVEANYDRELLINNESLPPDVKYRIMSNHFEIEDVKTFFRHQNLDQTIAIHLLHMSNDNSDKNMFVRQVEEITGKPVY